MEGKLARQLDLFAKQWAPRSGVCFKYTAFRQTMRDLLAVASLPSSAEKGSTPLSRTNSMPPPLGRSRLLQG